MPSSTTGHIAATTQQYLEILDITKDILLLKDGSTALVMEVSAINFGLLSEPEQDAIIYAYAALINSLSFPLQIVISSRPKDVSNYLEYIDEQYQMAPNELRRQQIASYRQFVANLITEQNVLDKNFFVVIPLSPVEVGLMGDTNPVSSVTGKKNTEFDKNAVIERALNTLIPRRDHMVSQFARFGLQTQQLGTKELIQLFYTLYNSQAAEGVKVVDTKDYTTTVIQAQGAQEAAPAPMAAPAMAPVAQPMTPAPTPVAQPQQPTAAPTPAPMTTQLPVEQPTMGVTAPAPAPVAQPQQPAAAPLVATPVDLPSAPTPAPSPVATPTATPTAIPQESAQMGAGSMNTPATAPTLTPPTPR